MRVLGVDPGATGALALYDADIRAAAIYDMPFQTIAKRKQVSEALLASILHDFAPDCAYIERVHAMPKQGVTSSFSFGLAYGLVRGVLACMEVPVHLITPQEWKRHFRLSSDKNEARAIAARLLPINAPAFARVKDDGRAEAALLALFGAQHPV